MGIIKNHKTLIEKLKESISETSKELIAIQAGHFPLRLNKGKRILEEGLDTWGEFSEYTFDVGCELAKYSQELGKKTRVYIVCDDLRYAKGYNLSREKDPRLIKWQKARLKFYRDQSKTLPNKYEEILKKYHLGNELIVKPNNPKNNSNYFSEVSLRDKNKDRLCLSYSACKDEYLGLLDKYISEEKDYFISFIPNICSHAIQDAIWVDKPNLKTSHIFVDTGVNSPLKSIDRQYIDEDITVYRK
ncbi:hypothetical protein ACFLZZ_00770 [Nanoarchaeota archaeon]